MSKVQPNKTHLGLATQQGYPLALCAKLTREGFQFQYGVWIKCAYVKEPAKGFMCEIAFLTNDIINPKVKTIRAMGRTEGHATRRAYRNQRLILEHGSLLAAWHAMADEAERSAAA